MNKSLTIVATEKKEKNDTALLLRMPEQLKAELQRGADLSGRRITAEINIRLRDSLSKPHEPGVAPTPPTTPPIIPIGESMIDDPVFQKTQLGALLAALPKPLRREAYLAATQTLISFLQSRGLEPSSEPVPAPTKEKPLATSRRV